MGGLYPYRMDISPGETVIVTSLTQAIVIRFLEPGFAPLGFLGVTAQAEKFLPMRIYASRKTGQGEIFSAQEVVP